MKYYILPLFIFLISFSSFAQIKNGGFENWDTTYTSPYENELLTVLNVPNALSGEIAGWDYATNIGITRTTDAYMGNYSVIVHNWYSYVWEYLYYRDSISSKPKFLTGHYKYIGQGLNGSWPHGIGSVVMVDNMGDTIVNTTHHFDTCSSYKPFAIPLTYLNANAVDSVFVTFQSSNQGCGNNMVCNLLYLDELGFSNVSTVEIKEAFEANVSVYPNPTSDIIQIEGVSAKLLIKVYNALGSLILESENSTAIDLSEFDKGIYYLKIYNRNKEIVRVEKIVKI